MKKAYAKPMAIVENFLLSEHIAACSGEFSNAIDFTNGLKFAGYFADDTCAEDKRLTEGSPFTYNGEEYCYHSFVDNKTVFSS